MKSKDSLDELQSSLAEYGLAVLGSLDLQSIHCAENHQELVGHLAVLVGNTGPVMWTVFAKSAENIDGVKDPMNRWTRRTISCLTKDIDCQIFYPFDKPYWPFQRMAKTAMRIKPSPLGILIHPEFGLWHALRAVLIFNPSDGLASQINELSVRANVSKHPCDNCLEKPCLNACPVSAFSETGLDINACFSHIDSGSTPDCMFTGCQARNACPIGIEHRYSYDQIRFHMKSYRGSSNS